MAEINWGVNESLSQLKPFEYFQTDDVCDSKILENVKKKMIIKYFAIIKGSRGFKTCLECSNQQNLIGLRRRRKGSHGFKTCLKSSNQQNLIGSRRRRTGILICVLRNILFDFVRHSAQIQNFQTFFGW